MEKNQGINILLEVDANPEKLSMRASPKVYRIIYNVHIYHADLV